MKRFGTLAVLTLALGAGCKGGGSSFQAEGTVTLDGQRRVVKGCDLQGKSVDSALRLTLDDGAVVVLPIHGGPLSVQRAGKDPVRLDDCEKRSSSGSGNDSHYKGALAAVCKGNGAALDLTLTVDCGG